MRFRKPWGRNRAQLAFYAVNGYFPGYGGWNYAVIEQRKELARIGGFWEYFGLFIFYLNWLFQGGYSFRLGSFQVFQFTVS